MKKIFISCVSSEFASLRQIAADKLKGRFEVDYQEEHPFGNDDLKEKLRKRIASCHGMIHIVGDAYGLQLPEADKKHGLISFTQWELRAARDRGIKPWLILPGPACCHNTPLERLDWDPRLDEEDAVQLQQERRHLQAEYRKTLLREFRKLEYREPKDDQEFRKVIDDLLKKEKRTRQIFTSSMVVGGLALLGAGLWAFNELEARMEFQESMQVAKTLRNAREDSDIFQGTARIPKEDLQIAKLQWASLDVLEKKDRKLWSGCITKLRETGESLAKERKDSKIRTDSIKTLRAAFLTETTDAGSKKLLLQAIAGYAFRIGEFDRSVELVLEPAAGINANMRCQYLFEIHYNRFSRSLNEKTKDKHDHSLQAIEDARDALGGLDPGSNEFAIYEFDLLHLLWAKGDIQINKLDRPLPDEAKATFNELIRSADFLKSMEVMVIPGKPVEVATKDTGGKSAKPDRNKAVPLVKERKSLSMEESKKEAERQQLRVSHGYLYLGLGTRGLGQAELAAFKPHGNENYPEKAIDCYFEAIRSLESAETVDDYEATKQAVTERADITSELSPLYSKWADSLLNSFREVTSRFERELADYGELAVREKDMGWQKQLGKSGQAYKVSFQKWQKEWKEFNDSCEEQSKKAETLAGTLKKKYNDEALQRVVALQVAEIRNQLTSRQATKAEYEDKADLAISKADVLEHRPKEEINPVVARDLTAIEGCLSELDIPNLAGAKRCIEKLDALAKKGGDNKKDIQDATELSQLIRNVFTSEANLNSARIGIPTAENEAAEHEIRAREYLRPNSFGTVRTEAARQHMLAAETLRRNSATRLATANESVSEQIRQTAKAARIYLDDQKKLGAADLAGLAYAVIDRSQPESDVKIPLTTKEVAAIKNEGKTIEGDRKEK